MKLKFNRIPKKNQVFKKIKNINIDLIKIVIYFYSNNIR